MLLDKLRMRFCRFFVYLDRCGVTMALEQPIKMHIHTCTIIIIAKVCSHIHGSNIIGRILVGGK